MSALPVASVRRRMPAVGALVLAGACSSSSGPPAPPVVFVAYASDFAGYHSWQAFVPTVNLPGNNHVSGPRTVYVARLPPRSAHEFAVGTIFVKESGGGASVFAAVKRGGEFNAAGNVGWEYFQLANGAGDQPTILWRGVGPANGDAYSPGVTGGCNLCHGSAVEYDYRWSAQEFDLLTPVPVDASPF
jgi:hypothetical protein